MADGYPGILAAGAAQAAQRVASSAFNNPSYNRLYLGIFGDSISQNGVSSQGVSQNGVVPPEWFVKGATGNSWRSWGWTSWIGPLSMQRIQVVRQWAVQSNGILCPGVSPAGFPLSKQIDLALADPLWQYVNRAVILIGADDCLRLAGTPTQCLSALKVQIARLGKPVDIITSPPNSSQPQEVTSGGMWVSWWLLQWRALLKRLADSSGGFIRVIDAYSLGNQPTAAVNDSYAAGMSLADGIHPNNAYAFKIAAAYVNATYPSSLTGDVDIWPSQGYSSSGSTGGLLDQLFLNCCFGTASGGSGTGTIAADLTVTNIGGGTHNGSVSATTIPFGVGNMQTLVLTSTAAGDGAQIASADMHAAGPGGSTPLAAGDQAYAQMLLRIHAGGILPRNLNYYLTGYQNPTNYYAWWNQNGFSANEVALPITQDTTMLVRTPILTMPAGSAFSNLQVYFQPTFAAAGSCTIDMCNFEVCKLPAGSTYLPQ